MNRKIKLKLIIAIIFCFSATNIKIANCAELLQRANFVYKGAFRVPGGNFGDVSTYSNSFSTDAGRGLAFNPTNNSLYMVGHKFEQLLAELSIPKIVRSTTKSDLNYATVLQNPIDISGGLRCYIGPGGVSKCGSTGVLLGGFLVYPDNSKIIGTSFATYNGESDVTLSHFSANADWNFSVDAKGMFALDGNVEYDHLTAGFVDGYMGWIPEEMQASFGGAAVTGNASLSVITRTSLGPSLFVFNPDDLGNGNLGSEGNPAKANPLVYYPAEHPTLGVYGTSPQINPTYNISTEITGVVWPAQTRSVIFLGRTGLGQPCYGAGTSDESQAATKEEVTSWLASNEVTTYACGSNTLDGQGGNACCYDPSSSAKGDHGYPYGYYAWVYDTNDLLDVKNKVKKPWEITPYAEWSLNADLDAFAPANGNKRIFGAAYDKSTQTVYISQVGADSGTYESMPIIHAYHIQTNDNIDTIPPSVAIDTILLNSTTAEKGDVVDIPIVVTDNDGITQVSLFIDNKLHMTSEGQPFLLSWDTSISEPIKHTLFVRAYDYSGNVGQSASYEMNVSASFVPIIKKISSK
jgi:hypothetical protein